MTKEWAQFWTAISFAVTVGAAAFMTTRGWNVGSLGEWLSGLGSLAAVGGALFIAENEARRARDIARDANFESREQLVRDEVRMLKALMLVLVNGRDSVAHLFSEIALTSIGIRGMARSYLSSRKEASVTACLNELTVQSMPTTRAIDILMAGRASWANLVDLVRLLEGETWFQHLVEVHERGTSELDVVIDALADEILERGGEPDARDDQAVSLRLVEAVKRRSQGLPL